MKKERRAHNRIKAKNIKAKVSSSLKSTEETDIYAEILDISRCGIRIKLDTPLNVSCHSKISIHLTLPSSGEPFSVHGILKHRHSDTEYGLSYTDYSQDSVDDILFECVKLNTSTLLIKSF